MGFLGKTSRNPCELLAIIKNRYSFNPYAVFKVQVRQTPKSLTFCLLVPHKVFLVMTVLYHKFFLVSILNFKKIENQYCVLGLRVTLAYQWYATVGCTLTGFVAFACPPIGLRQVYDSRV